jgi:hypothetical protein
VWRWWAARKGSLLFLHEFFLAPGSLVGGSAMDLSANPCFSNEVAVRESSKNNPTILSARDATAHAPAPNWIDVDRDALKGRIQSVPKRDELVQIQLNEQLIVELYSK